jgi:Tol biopolymer transport system component
VGVWSLLILILAAGSAAAGTIDLISKADPSPDTIGGSFFSSASADGRYVVFESDAPNLVPGQVDTNFFYDVFLRDRVAGTTTLITHASGNPGNLNVASPAEGSLLALDAGISADGRYIAFISVGIDLVPGVTDANRASDVFLYDRVTGATTLISHAAGNPATTANARIDGCRISADGNYVVFASSATNLVAGQTVPPPGEEVSNVFLYQRSSGALTLIGHGNGPSVSPEISADGGFVVFLSSATDLVPGQTDTNGGQDVFLYERASGAVSLVSRASGSSVRTGSQFSGDAHVSADGRWIAFTSSSNNLLAGQIDGFTPDAFLFDRVTGQMRLASHTAGSPQTAAGLFSLGGNIAMSTDGHYVTFVSQAANLVAGQVNLGTGPNVFVYDRIADQASLVSHAPGSPATSPAGSDSRRPSLSADGRYVAFESTASLVSHQNNPASVAVNVFVYDQVAGTMVLASHGKGSLTEGANDFSSLAFINPDGSVVAFSSYATDLGAGQFDPNHFLDLFLFDRKSADLASLTQRDSEIPPATPYGPSTAGGISADGRFVAFVSRANGLIPGQIDQPWAFAGSDRELGNWDVFLRDLTTGKTTLVSRSTSSPLTAAGGFEPALSADGQFLAFVSRPNSDGALGPLYLYDRTVDSLTLITHTPGSPAVAEGIPTETPVVSADGRFVAFTCSRCRSDASQPAPNPSSAEQIFLYDRVTGTNTLVSHVPGSPTTAGDGRSTQPRISADGRFVVFAGTATNLVAGQTGPTSQNLFVFDQTTGAVSLVTHTAGSATTAASFFSESPEISADGRWILFESRATDLVTGQGATSTVSVFLYDRTSGANLLVSHASTSAVTGGNGDSHPSFFGPPTMSADGRWIVFQSTATDLVAGVTDANGTVDIYLYDRLSGNVSLVSFAAGTPTTTANQSSHTASVSADGSRIAFQSAAANLVSSGATGLVANLFVQERATGVRTLVGRQYSNDIGVILGTFLKPVMSADGGRVAFTSDAALVPRDFNFNWDVYLFDDSGSTGPPPGPTFPCTAFDGAALRSNVRQVFPVSALCGLPATAKQVTVKVTVSEATGKGSVQLYPGNVTRKPPGTLAFQRRQTKAATFTVPLATNGAGTLALLPTVASHGTVHVVVEVEGFIP